MWWRQLRECRCVPMPAALFLHHRGPRLPTAALLLVAGLCRWPYIAALPEELPCGWALPPTDLSAALAGLGSLADGWQPQVEAAAVAVQQRCEAAAAAWGHELGGVTAAEVRWGLGQVVSRSFGSGGLLQACFPRHGVASTLLPVQPVRHANHPARPALSDCSPPPIAPRPAAAQVMTWRCCHSLT